MQHKLDAKAIARMLVIVCASAMHLNAVRLQAMQLHAQPAN